MAERVGFEPTCPLRDNTLSRRAPSSARSPLRIGRIARVTGELVVRGCPRVKHRLSKSVAERGGFEPPQGTRLTPLHDFE